MYQNILFMKLISIFALIVSNMLAYAQNDPVSRAGKLVEDKKYESAIKVLMQADPENKDPEISKAKTEIFLKYFVASIMHQLFGMKDLSEDEDIMEVRGKSGEYSMFAFAPDSVLQRLIDRFPQNYELYKTLGYFYHEVNQKYPERWLLPDSVVVGNFKKYYKIAYDHGVYDYWSAYGIGYACLLQKDFKGSIPYFVRSIELRDDYPSSHYNLAYAYLFTDQHRKAIESAKKALELYNEPQFKADAAKMIAVIYEELDEPEKAWEYYKIANDTDPRNYYTLKPLLDTEVKLGKKSYPERTNEFFRLAPGNPTIYQDLIEIYRKYGREDELLEFLNMRHGEFIRDDKVNGNLYFYTAVIQYNNEDFTNARLNFEKAREIFKNVYGPDHGVFKAIDSYVNER